MEIYDVFISYRRSDGYEIAENLYNFLTNKGLRVFWDKKKMIDGHYFDTQIKTNLCRTPNVVLIATKDVFSFRPDKDWVRSEIAIALEEYEKATEERTITVIQTNDCVFPEEKDLPEKIKNITKENRISYSDDNAFDRVFKGVTNASRRNLWHAAHRWLEVSKQPGARFARLDIKNGIMPNTSKQKSTSQELPIHVDTSKDSSHPKPLFQAMAEIDGPVYLIGEGGIGKTTALIHIMNKAYLNKEYTKTAQIPIFVELSFAPDTFGPIYKNGKSSFIRRSIYRQLRMDKTARQIGTAKFEEMDTVFDLPEDVAVNPLNDIFTKQTPEPEYILLLDGLNEVSSTFIDETGLTVVQMIQKEIMFLLEDCPNVRVILTSRSDDSCIYHDSITRLYLSGVNDEAIRFYLKENEKTEGQIDAAFRDRNLLETLRNPLFLTMYGSLDAIESVSTQGEILHLFFNERRNNLDIYTVQDRIRKIEVEGGKTGTQRLGADIQNFILDFILPRLAYKMEKMGVFYLRADVIQKEIEPVLTLKNETDICGTYGKEFFTKYRTSSAKNHTNQVAKEILKKLGDDIEEVAESIIDCCVLSFGILQETGGEYGFTHQHIRDYFAAIENINMLQLACYIYENGKAAVALKCLQPFGEKPVHLAVRKFIGEVLGEHRNKPYFENEKWHYAVPKEPCDRNLLKRVLNVYRNLLEGECEYSLHSIISILREIREDLSGEDLSCLDLSRCSMNGLMLGNCDFGASLKGTIINLDTIGDTFNSGFSVADHTIYVSDISVDGTKLLLKRGLWSKVELWDAETMLPTSHFLDFDDYGYFTSDERYILGERYMLSRNSINLYLCLYDVKTYNWIKLEKAERNFVVHNNRCLNALFLSGFNLVLIFKNTSVALWEIEGASAQKKFEYCFASNFIHEVLYDPIRKRFIVEQKDGVLYVYDYDEDRGCLKSENKPDTAVNIGEDKGRIWFTKNYKYILSIGETLKIVNADTFEIDPMRQLNEKYSINRFTASVAMDDNYIYLSTLNEGILYISLQTFAVVDCFYDKIWKNYSLIAKDRPYSLCEDDNRLMFWNLKTKTLVSYIPIYSKTIQNIYYVSERIIMIDFKGILYTYDFSKKRFGCGNKSLISKENKGFIITMKDYFRKYSSEYLQEYFKNFNEDDLAYCLPSSKDFFKKYSWEFLQGDFDEDERAYCIPSSDNKRLYIFVIGKPAMIIDFDTFVNKGDMLITKTPSINFEGGEYFPLVESHSGRYQAIITNTDKVIIIDTELKKLRRIPIERDINIRSFTKMFFTSKEEYLVIIFCEREFVVYNSVTLESVLRYSHSESSIKIQKVSISPNGKYIAFTTSNEKLFEINTFTKEISEPIDLSTHFIPGIFMENVDFNIANLNEMTKVHKKILRQYGAIFDE